MKKYLAIKMDLSVQSRDPQYDIMQRSSSYTFRYFVYLNIPEIMCALGENTYSSTKCKDSKTTMPKNVEIFQYLYWHEIIGKNLEFKDPISAKQNFRKRRTRLIQIIGSVKKERSTRERAVWRTWERWRWDIKEASRSLVLVAEQTVA